MSDKAIIITEKQILKRFDEMCAESLSPDVYSIWTNQIIPALNKIRKQLKQSKNRSKSPMPFDCFKPYKTRH